MKKLLIVGILISSSFIGFAQIWSSKDYLDDFGDPSGRKYIFQNSYGLRNSEQVKITISCDLPQSEYFILIIGEKLNPVEELLKINESSSNTTYLLRYKIGDTEASLKISAGYSTFKIGFSSLDKLLKANSSPIKCVISKDTYPIKYYTKPDKKGQPLKPVYEDKLVRSNICQFTIYPSNYKQILQ